MLNTNTLDTSLTRPIKRGKQGERTVRPNSEKFANTQNFEPKHFSTDLGELGGGGGMWLGNSYNTFCDDYFETKEEVLEGIVT